MQIWNDTIADVVKDKRFIEMSEMLPEDDRLMLVKFDLFNGTVAYDVCKYNHVMGLLYVYFTDKIVASVNDSIGDMYWMYITEDQAYKIWDVDRDKIIDLKKCQIYAAYKEYLADFVKCSCRCNPSDNTYASPRSFVEWLEYEGIDVESVIETNHEKSNILS